MLLLQRLSVLLAFAVLATAVHAQVFRSIMPDGKIVYGSKPEPGAKESKQVDLPPPNIAMPPAAAPARKPAATGDTSPAKEPAAPDVNAARQKLEAAQKALEDGRELREGDRTGVASKGMSQLNEEYYKRVNKLEEAVATAQKEYDTARLNSR
jgi:hypothetical protein